jgi:hypothetical protein
VAGAGAGRRADAEAAHGDGSPVGQARAAVMDGHGTVDVERTTGPIDGSGTPAGSGRAPAADRVTPAGSGGGGDAGPGTPKPIDTPQ